MFLILLKPYNEKKNILKILFKIIFIQKVRYFGILIFILPKNSAFVKLYNFLRSFRVCLQSRYKIGLFATLPFDQKYKLVRPLGDT